MELLCRLELPDALFSELESAAAECKMTPGAWAAEAVEVLLAERRLPVVSSLESTPRMLGHVPQKRTESERDEASALTPAEIPSAADLDALEDIA